MVAIGESILGQHIPRPQEDTHYHRKGRGQIERASAGKLWLEVGDSCQQESLQHVDLIREGRGPDHVGELRPG